MKTPDEIKKGLECRIRSYRDTCDHQCHTCDLRIPAYSIYERYEDALALIQQLQAENAEQAERIRVLENHLREATKKVKQLEAERDALIHWAKGRCDTCAHNDDCVKHDPDPEGYVMRWYDDCEIWEWRGVQKEDGNAQ